MSTCSVAKVPFGRASAGISMSDPLAKKLNESICWPLCLLLRRCWREDAGTSILTCFVIMTVDDSSIKCLRAHLELEETDLDDLTSVCASQPGRTCKLPLT